MVTEGRSGVKLRNDLVRADEALRAFGIYRFELAPAVKGLGVSPRKLVNKKKRTPIVGDHFALFVLRPLAQRKERQARAEAQRTQRMDTMPLVCTNESYYLPIGCMTWPRFPLCVLRALCARKVHQGG